MTARLFELPPPDRNRSFQSRSTYEGQLVLREATDRLKLAGFEVLQPGLEISSLGVEVNLVARDRLGERWYCEVTGAHQGRRPGLRRTDTVRKVLGSGHLLAQGGFRPFIVLTTHVPARGTRGDRMLRASRPDRIFDVIELNDPAALLRLHRYALLGALSGPEPGWWDHEELVENTIFQVPKSPLREPQPALDGLVVTGKLGHRISFYVPTVDRSGHLVDGEARARFLEDLYRWFSRRNDGHTRLDGIGGYTPPMGPPIEESVTIVSSYTNHKVTLPEIRPFVLRCLVELLQETVAVVIDGEMFLLAHDGSSGITSIEPPYTRSANDEADLG